MFRPISIDPISSESSGLGLTVLELPPDAILYQIQLDRSYVMVREQWTSVLQVIVYNQKAKRVLVQYKASTVLTDGSTLHMKVRVAKNELQATRSRASANNKLVTLFGMGVTEIEPGANLVELVYYAEKEWTVNPNDYHQAISLVIVEMGIN
jgi:hypothetical protein